MAYFPSLGREALPVGNNVFSRGSKSGSLIMFIFAFMFFASLLGSTNAYNPRSLDLDEDAANLIKRATKGDKYLLGVGKADITG